MLKTLACSIIITIKKILFFQHFLDCLNRQLVNWLLTQTYFTGFRPQFWRSFSCCQLWAQLHDLLLQRLFFPPASVLFATQSFLFLRLSEAALASAKTWDVKRSYQQGVLGKSTSHVWRLTFHNNLPKKQVTFLAINAKVQRKYHNFPQIKYCIIATFVSFILLQCILNEGNYLMH